MAVYMIDGAVTDHSIWVEDDLSGFHIWSRNLDRALELQFKEGRPGGFGLRGYELDFDALDAADSTTDSFYRAEILSIDEFRFAVASCGIEFQPEILYTTFDQGTGLQVYETGGFGPDEGAAARPEGEYFSVIDAAIEFFDLPIENYIGFSHTNAVRLAAQGGLAEFFVGVCDDPAADLGIPVGGRKFGPIFAAAPGDEIGVYDWLTDWREILEAIHPDCRASADDELTEKYLWHKVVIAYENQPAALSLTATAERMGVDEENILTYAPGTALVEGTRKGDLIYVLGENSLIRGGLGGDIYVVGRIFDGTIIEDVETSPDPRNADFLRFAHLTADEILAEKDGIDLILTEIATGQTLTVKRQFDGKFIGIFGRDWSDDTEMVKIHFADGAARTVYDLAFATSHSKDSDDLVPGTPTIDVLEGGKGNDIMRGGRDADTCIIRQGDGVAWIEDDNDQIFSKGHDIVQFAEGIEQNQIRFICNGDSDDLELRMLDETGAETGQRLIIENQFDTINTWLFGVRWLDRIEWLVSHDQSFPEESRIMEPVVEQARTDQADVIFGFRHEDTPDGGLGDDVLSGGDLNDTYFHAPSYGFDAIEDNLKDFLSPSYDILKIATYGVDDFILERISASPTLTLRVAGSDTDAIQLVNQFRLTSTVLFGDHYHGNVDEIQFGDLALWDMATLGRRLIAQAGTDGDDVISGFDMRDTLGGGLGNDRLEGGAIRTPISTRRAMAPTRSMTSRTTRCCRPAATALRCAASR